MTTPYQDGKQLNVITVVSMSSHEMQAQIYPLLKVPKVGPNHNIDIEEQLVPLLSDIANQTSWLSQLHAVCISAKADMDIDSDVKKFGPQLIEMRAKIEILYRAIKASDGSWSAVSRMLSVLLERPHSRLLRAGC